MILNLMAAAGGGSQLLMSALTTLGLTTNLKLCLDAGDAASYTSGQKWLDRSGNGYDFFLGADGNADATDPTLTGPPGAPTTYWLFDGGDYFTYDTTNETWMQNLHKDNAILSMVAFYYQDGATDTFGLFGDDALTDTNVGSNFQVDAGRVLGFDVRDGSGTRALAINADTALAAGSWHMVGVSLTEATGAGGGFLYADGAYLQVGGSDTFNSSYNTPSASSATYTVQIGASGNNFDPAGAGQRLSCIAVWEGTALSKANMDSIWSSMRGRFGL